MEKRIHRSERRVLEFFNIPKYTIENGHVIKLNLSDNQLTTLPESIGNLVNLQYLYLYNNQLTTLPESIGNLVNLQYLSLSNNPIKSLSNIPKTILKIIIIQNAHLTGKGHQLYINKQFNEIFEYYHKTPTQLVQEYISDPQSLTGDERERLIHEMGTVDKKIIENWISIEDPLFDQIFEMNSLELSNGLKIYL